MDITDSYDLECEMRKDAIVIAYLADVSVAKEFYSSLCNMRWKKIVDIPEDQQIIDKLKGIGYTGWSCSWRGAARIIADIRNVNYNKSEDYVDFYCSGMEGLVSTRVNECFERMGWKQCPRFESDYV